MRRDSQGYEERLGPAVIVLAIAAVAIMYVATMPNVCDMIVPRFAEIILGSPARGSNSKQIAKIPRGKQNSRTLDDD